jgi:hypothetical protein
MSGHAGDFGGAEGVEAVHEGDANVDLVALAVQVSRDDALADAVVKRRLEDVLETLFRAIRVRRAAYAKDPGYVLDVIRKGRKAGKAPRCQMFRRAWVCSGKGRKRSFGAVVGFADLVVI